MKALRSKRNPSDAERRFPRDKLQQNQNSDDVSSDMSNEFKWTDIESSSDDGAAACYTAVLANVTESVKWDSNTADTISNKFTNDICDGWCEDDIDEDAVSKNYPKDCYSFIALYYPGGKEWPSFVFLLGFVVFSFQMTFLILLILSVTSEKFGTIGEIDNPGKSIGAKIFPANTKQIVRATQIFSMLTSFLFPYSSLQDVIKAVFLFPRSWQGNKSGLVRWMRFSCFLRFLQGIVAIFASWLLVMKSENVVDIILNFTAVNFISSLDEIAYSMAKSGELGLNLKKKLKTIEKTKLPPRVFESKMICHWCVVILTSFVFFTVMIVVMVAQERNDIWSTKELRVRFHDETGIEEYSGCFQTNSDSGYSSKRHTYHRFEGKGHTPTAATIGYCEENRHWVLLKGDHTNPCIADRANELAHSAKTDTFDIQTSFEESWVSSSGTPLEFFFFPDGTNGTCSSFIGDGTCDAVFNKQDYSYDDGDCCAATCTGSNCGLGQNSFFGGTDTTGTGFPNCIDEKMVSITIHLNSIRSSRDPIFVDFDRTLGQRLSINEDEWRDVMPEKTLFSVECNGKIVLSTYIDNSMENKNETVKVEDGASCSLVIRNTTTNGFIQDVLRDDPIWIIDYTIFHDRVDIKATGGNEQVEILSALSNEVGSMNFTRVWDSFIQILEGYVDIETIYTHFAPSNKAFNWLLEHDNNNGNLLLNNEFFIERFALATLDFTLSNETSFIGKKDQCIWSNIKCKNGRVTQLDLNRRAVQAFSEEMMTSVQILSHLEELNFGGNQISVIPSSIGLLSNLNSLSFYSNKIESIPSDLLSMTKLTSLDFGENRIRSIPSEIGSMQNMVILNFGNNGRIASMPTEIGLMTSLTTLDLSGNTLTAIPAKIGSMGSIKRLNMAFNKIKYIPKTIGSMINLKHLHLGFNDLKQVPDEMGNMISLINLDLYLNKIENITSGITSMTKMEYLNLGHNRITSIPSDIGLMTRLKDLDLDNNEIQSIPSEIGSITTLINLDLGNNEILFIPSEIGLMTSLTNLDLASNLLTSIPSEIGLITSLKKLHLNGNNFSFVDLPTEVQELCNSNSTICEIGQ